MRVFFGPSVAMPAGLTAAGQALFRTLQKYGAVIDDQTAGGPPIPYNPDGSYKSGGALMIRAELDTTGTGPCAQLAIGSALEGIPWAQISGPIKMGSDASPNPLSNSGGHGLWAGRASTSHPTLRESVPFGFQ
jgi:hypothetical protein